MPLSARIVEDTRWWVHLEVAKRCQVDLPRGTWHAALGRMEPVCSQDWIVLTLPDGQTLRLTVHEWQQAIKHAKYRRRAQRLAARLQRQETPNG